MCVVLHPRCLVPRTQTVQADTATTYGLSSAIECAVIATPGALLSEIDRARGGRRALGGEQGGTPQLHPSKSALRSGRPRVPADSCAASGGTRCRGTGFRTACSSPSPGGDGVATQSAQPRARPLPSQDTLQSGTAAPRKRAPATRLGCEHPAGRLQTCMPLRVSKTQQQLQLPPPPRTRDTDADSQPRRAR